MLVLFAATLAAAEPTSSYLICTSSDSSTGPSIGYVGEPIPGVADDIPQAKNAFKEQVRQQYGITLGYAGCASAESTREAKDAFAYAIEVPTKMGAGVVVVKWSGTSGQDWSSSSAEQTPKASEEATAQSEASNDEAPPPPHHAKKSNAEADAEFEAAQEVYKQKLAEQQRQVDDYNHALDDVARKKAEQHAAAERALAAHGSEMAAHEEVLRLHEQEMAAYKAEVAAAATKVQSDFDKRNNLGKASTDTDANLCITSPELQADAAFKGNTAASVVNGCGKPVDVKICLMRDPGGWNCGVRWGLQPQDKWSHSSFHATGQVFVDARTSGSSKSLASPD
jgi:hypothetical protein